MKNPKFIPVDKFWKEYAFGKYIHICKTLVELEDGTIDFAYVMGRSKSFDHHRQGVSFKKKILKVLIYDET